MRKIEVENPLNTMRVFSVDSLPQERNILKLTLMGFASLYLTYNINLFLPALTLENAEIA